MRNNGARFSAIRADKTKSMEISMSIILTGLGN